MSLTDAIKGLDTNNTKQETNTTKIDFDSIVSNFKNNPDVSISTSGFALEEIGNSLNDKNSTEVRNILLPLYQAKNYDKINEYIGKLQKIVDKYEVEKAKAVGEALEEGKGLSEEVLNAPEIKDPKEFIKSFLEANKGFIDGSFTRVNDTITQTEGMSDSEIGEMLYSNKLESPFKESWAILDVEPEEWDLYFKEHNIPKEKQNQLKKYFSKLMESKDFGNTLTDFFKNDFGTKIANEAERIMSLGSKDKIIINIPELNPSTGNIEFKSKKDALLYLYYNKILLREVATFMEDIIVGAINVGKGAVWTGEFVLDHFSEIIIGFIAFMGANISGTVFRNINAYVVRKQIPFIQKLAVGEFLRKSTSPLEGEESREAAELKEREKYIELLEEKYKGNSKKLKEIESVKKYIRVLDHNIDSSEEDINKLSEIEEKISERREKLEKSDTNKQAKKRLKKELSDLNKQKSKLNNKLYRFSESTFWRKVLHIEGGNIHQNKYVDTLLKPWLFNTEAETMDSLNSFEKIVKDTQNDLFDESGKKIGILEQAENFIKRSHEVPNDKEKEVKDIFNKYVKKLRDGEFGKLEGADKKEMLNSIKLSILDEIKSKTGVELESRIFTEGNNLDNAKDFFFDGFNDFEPERGTNKKNKWVENLFEEDVIDTKKLNEIKKFFAEIQKGDNEYNRRTAIDIVARIINDDLDYKTAINKSFETSWDEVKKINIDSDFRGSLSNLVKLEVKQIEIEVVEEPKTEDVKVEEPKVEEVKEITKTVEAKEISPEEKIKKLDSLYERANLQAELNGIDGIEERYFNIDIENTTIKQEESFIRNKFGLEKISDLRKITELKAEKKLILNKLIDDGILTKVGDTFEIKGSIDNLTKKLEDFGKPHFVEYIKKSFKTGG